MASTLMDISDVQALVRKLNTVALDEVFEVLNSEIDGSIRGGFDFVAVEFLPDSQMIEVDGMTVHVEVPSHMSLTDFAGMVKREAIQNGFEILDDKELSFRISWAGVN